MEPRHRGLGVNTRFVLTWMRFVGSKLGSAISFASGKTMRHDFDFDLFQEKRYDAVAMDLSLVKLTYVYFDACLSRLVKLTHGKQRRTSNQLT